jgi:hypothetical protein
MPLGSKVESRALFQALETRLPAAAHPVAERLADFCDQRRQFDLQVRMHFWLQSWLAAHVALSVALTLLMIVHAVLALEYL